MIGEALVVKRSLTCPLFVTHGEQVGFVGELWEQTAAFHDYGLWNHDHTGNQPNQNNTLAGSFGSALELQGVADSIPAILGNAAQCQNRYRHRDCLEDNIRRTFFIPNFYKPGPKWDMHLARILNAYVRNTCKRVIPAMFIC